MPHSDAGEVWETSVDDLGATRWTAATGGATLVTLKLSNDSDSAVAVQLVEEVPETVTAAVPITTAGDDSDAWRYLGNWIVHDLTIPADGERTTAYVLESEDEPPLAVATPEVNEREEIADVPGDGIGRGPTVGSPDGRTPVHRAIERGDVTAGRGLVARKIDEAMQRAIEGPSASETAVPKPDEPATTDGAGPLLEETSSPQIPARASAPAPSFESAAPGAGKSRSHERGAPVPEPGSPGTDEDASVVEDLIDELEEDASSAQRRALRDHLGASESERARIEHVQSRVDDLAVYIDALEALVDEHGIGVFEEVRDSVDETASTTATLRERLADLEAAVEDHRSETDESIGAIENDVTALQSGLEEHLEALESSLEATRTQLESMHEEFEGDRQAGARVARQFDRSLGDVEDAIDRLDARVRECESFHERFTKVIASGAPPSRDHDRSGPAENDRSSVDD